MLLLTGQSDLVQLITTATAGIDVHASWVDYAAGTVTPGATNTAVTTATTATITGALAASTQRNVKTLNLRNKHATDSNDVTVAIQVNSTAYELLKMTLSAGDTLEYAEGVGFFKVPNPVLAPLPKVAVTDQTIGTNATVYLTNSDLHVVAGRPLKVGTTMRWTIGVAKSAAATAAMVFDLRVGTGGTTGDSTRGSLSTGTQTGAADTAYVNVQTVVRSLGASGTLDTLIGFQHNLQTTGMAIIPALATDITSGTFDTSASGLIFGMSITTGTAHAVTVKNVLAEFIEGTI